MKSRTIRSSRVISSIAAAAACFPLSAVWAAATPVGPEFQVSGSQVYLTDPQVARSSKGNAAVVWEDIYHVPAQLYARLYDADGSPAGDPIELALYTPPVNGINNPKVVAIDDDGDFAIVGVNGAYSNGATAESVVVQRYSADGSPEGDLINVAPMLTVGGETDNLSIAMDPNGDFVVGWTNILKTEHWCTGFGYLRFCSYDEGSNTYARVYNKDGTPKTDALVEEQRPVTTLISLNDKQHKYDMLSGLAMNAGGQFAMGFNTTNSVSSQGATAMVFNADGSAASGVINLTSASLSGARVGLDSQGNLVTAWLSGFASATNSKINTAAYSSSGSSLWHHSFSAPSGYEPILNVQPNGNFVLAWNVRLSNNAGYQETAQYFNANGSANGASFSITQNPATDMANVDAAIDANGNLFGVWSRQLGDSTSSDEVVMGRLYNAP